MNSSAGALSQPQEPPAARAPGRRGATFEAVALPLLLSVGTFIAFFPALSNNFVAWDDAWNLARNPGYRGLGWAQLRWMLTTILGGHYVPLTWISFGLDYVLWGMNPFGYHLTSLLLHVAAVLLFCTP
jgi:hypothetical protein